MRVFRRTHIPVFAPRYGVVIQSYECSKHDIDVTTGSYSQQHRVPSRILSKTLVLKLIRLTTNIVVHYPETGTQMKCCSIPVSVQNLEREKQEC